MTVQELVIVLQSVSGRREVLIAKPGELIGAPVKAVALNGANYLVIEYEGEEIDA